MKIKILLVILCVVYSSFTVAKAQNQKLLLETLSAKLSAKKIKEFSESQSEAIIYGVFKNTDKISSALFEIHQWY